MKFARWFFWIAGICGVSFAQDTSPRLSDLGWLSGCWEGVHPTRRYTEHWMQPAGGMMLGMSRTVVEGKVREYEYLRIVEDGRGGLFYVAMPSGQKEALFKLIRGSATEVVFENPDHDFPQRIIYRLLEGGSLLSRIEGVSRGKERAVDFPMNRTKCD